MDANLNGLVFGQQHATTGPWLVERFGQAHTVPVADMPHAALYAGDEDTYLDYLGASWQFYPKTNTEAARIAHMRNQAQIQPGPVKAVQRPDGRWMIVDGNHRAAAAFHAGVEPEIIPVPAAKWLAATTSIPDERYGSRPGRPYQSVFDAAGREWVVGRRRDTFARHEAIGASDVLDLGCNIGAATILAGGHGVDRSPRMVTAAWRLAGFFASPATFAVADLNRDIVYDMGTVFCFAVVAHLDRLDTLRDMLARASVVWFEENTGRPQLPKVADLFTEIVPVSGGDRPLYRCTP